MFITFEGVDRTGKSTTVDRVSDILTGMKISNVIIHESGDPIVQYIKQTKLPIERILRLFWKMRQEHQIILKEYDTEVIIFDRYFDSTFVYANELMDVMSVHSNFSHDLFKIPDATIYLYADPEVLLKRRDDDDRFTSSSKKSFVKRMTLYDECYEKYHLDRKLLKVDNSERDEESVADLCADFIKDLVKKRGKK